MKDLFKTIFAFLEKVGLNMEDLNSRIDAIPNFDALLKTLKDLEKKVAEIDNRCIENDKNLSQFKIDIKTDLDTNV